MNGVGGSLLVGLGSSYGDDRLGWHIAEILQGRQLSGLRVRLATSPLGILDWLDGVERLLICDACQGGGRPGSTHRWRWPDEALAPVQFSGSHDLGLTTVLRLAEQLRQLPPRVTIWAVEGAPAAPSAVLMKNSMSLEVLAAVPRLLASIDSELRS
jgi:hydrogenase maturation protease